MLLQLQLCCRFSWDFLQQSSSLVPFRAANSVDFNRAVLNGNVTIYLWQKLTDEISVGSSHHKNKWQAPRQCLDEQPHNKTMHSTISTRCLCKNMTPTMTSCWYKPCDVNSHKVHKYAKTKHKYAVLQRNNSSNKQNEWQQSQHRDHYITIIAAYRCCLI